MKKKTFSILAALFFVAQGAWAQGTETTPTWEGEGTSENPYLIQLVDDWNKLAEGSQTSSYEGKYFLQTSNISPAQTMVGSEAFPFAGIYDGGGNTTTFELECHDFQNDNNKGDFAAPFQRIKGATIKRLHIDGVIKGDLHMSGLVGQTFSEEDNDAQPPTNIIEDCRVSAEIWSYETHAAGFIGHGQKAKNILKGCIFDGQLHSMYNGDKPTYAAPFIGWCHYAGDDRNTLQGCFEKGTYSSHHSTNFNTALYYVHPDLTTNGVTVYRTFHSQDWNDGHHGYTVTSGTDGMSFEYYFEKLYKGGENNVKKTDYSTSGITYYDAGSPDRDASDHVVGIFYDNKLYAANGNLVVFYPQSASNYYDYTNFKTTSGSLVNYGLTCDLTMGAGNSVITASPYVILNNDEDNSSTLTHTKDMTGVTVRLYNRTLSKTGLWNTLCLPFDLTVADSPLAGATIKTLDDASLSEDGTLTLNFSENSPTTIDAGTPFIVKWDNVEGTGATEDEEDTDPTKLKSPVFNKVTIKNTLNDVVINGVLTFKGIFSRLSIEEADNTKLYLGADGNNATLYYPNAEMKIEAFRAYFQLADGITAGEKANAIRAFVLNFGDGEQTGIEDAAANSSLFTLHSSLQQWYTLDGRRLSGKPTQPGIYVESGKKVVIK